MPTSFAPKKYNPCRHDYSDLQSILTLKIKVKLRPINPYPLSLILQIWPHCKSCMISLVTVKGRKQFVYIKCCCNHNLQHGCSFHLHLQYNTSPIHNGLYAIYYCMVDLFLNVTNLTLYGVNLLCPRIYDWTSVYQSLWVLDIDNIQDELCRSATGSSCHLGKSRSTSNGL